MSFGLKYSALISLWLCPCYFFCYLIRDVIHMLSKVIGKSLKMSISKNSTITDRLDVIEKVYESFCNRMFIEMQQLIDKLDK